MKELKKLDSWEAKCSGTYVTLDTAVAKSLLGAADIGTTDATKVTPRNDLAQADFDDIWIVGDYSDKNGDTNGGYVAIKLMNALSTGGFQLQTADKAKGQMAFEYTAHYSMSAQDTVPFEIYVKAGTAEAG
nr:MAG TPA: major tail protein [Caudoviricetes sp.]